MHNLFIYLNKISPIGQEVLAEMSPLIKKVNLKKDDHFVKAGEYSKDIGFLEAGIVRAYFSKDGKDYNKTLFVAPSVIGSFGSIISGKPNQLPQQALTDCTVWKFPFYKVEELSEKYIELERLRRKIAEHFFLLKEKRELEMAMLEAEERYLIFRKDYPGIEMQIPQYHIASYLGISATQLSRIRKKMSLSD
jgi:CRP-like cAMP-binding protein